MESDSKHEVAGRNMYLILHEINTVAKPISIVEAEHIIEFRWEDYSNALLELRQCTDYERKPSVNTQQYV